MPSVGDHLRTLGRLLRNAEGARREQIFHQARRVTPFVGVEHDGIRFILSTSERGGVGLRTFRLGFFDEEVIDHALVALARHAGIATLNGLSVLDVGANFGTETVSFLVRHGVKRVIAVEPDPENARLLRANLALNGVEYRAQVLEIALSDADGTLVLEHSEENWGDHRIRVANGSALELGDEGRRATVQVEARRLDSLADAGEIDLDDIGMVWMDAQGHEGHILAGAERVTAAGIPIVTEYWPYGLQRAGGLERFHELVAERYHTAVDLQQPEIALDAGRVSELADRYVANPVGRDPGTVFTDLLLLSG
jgi:FkbM family methyltransferase